MTKNDPQYHARLFRGWEMVHLHYALEGDQVVLRRKATWKAPHEQRVDLSSLSGETRRVWGRQPAYVIMTVVILIALLVMGIDAMMHGNRGIYWPLWGPLLTVVLVAGYIRTKTRRAAEWTHFVGRDKGVGVFVLKDGKNVEGHKQFTDAVKRRLG